MDDPIARIVALIECEAMAACDPGLTDYPPQSDKSISEEMTKLVFRDIPTTREPLRLSVAHIVKARNNADDSLNDLRMRNDTR